MYARVHRRRHACARTHARTHTHTCARTHVHAHARTCTCTHARTPDESYCQTSPKPSRNSQNLYAEAPSTPRPPHRLLDDPEHPHNTAVHVHARAHACALACVCARMQACVQVCMRGYRSACAPRTYPSSTCVSWVAVCHGFARHIGDILDITWLHTSLDLRRHVLDTTMSTQNLRHGTVRHSTARRSTARHGTAWHGRAWHGTTHTYTHTHCEHKASPLSDEPRAPATAITRSAPCANCVRACVHVCVHA